MHPLSAKWKEDVLNDDIVFAADQPSATTDRMLHRGELVRLTAGVYGRITDGGTPEQFTKRHWPQIAGRLFPQAVITDRSARTGGPVDGVLYLAHTATRDRTVQLPGLTITARRGGLPPQPDDIALPDGLWIASRGRSLADNARESRARSIELPRTLRDDELADWIDDLARIDGPERLVQYRQRLEELAGPTGSSPRKVALIAQAVGAALGTQTVRTRSRALRARQNGRPYDRSRIDRFDILAEALLRATPQYLPLDERNPNRYRYEPFYEAYFSNFIEGTEFTLEEAESIVLDGKFPYERAADGHDLLGTYRLVADPVEMSRIPATTEEFADLLRYRNSVIMAGRPENRPGEFKLTANRAGQTQFVDPDLVDGTLREGFRLIEQLDTAWQRAVYTAFLVAEVHPFADGNGRTARVMMNAELHAAGQSRIIIVNAFRTDYLDGLRALSRRDDSSIFISAMRIASNFTAGVDFTELGQARSQLEDAYAFDETAVLVRNTFAAAPGSRSRPQQESGRLARVSSDRRVPSSARGGDGYTR